MCSAALCDRLLVAKCSVVLQIMACSLHRNAAVMQDIDEAIHRLPQDVVDARMQRLKRAVDCSLKKSYLSKEIQDMQTPYSWYLKVIFHHIQHSNCICKVNMQCNLAFRTVLESDCSKATADYICPLLAKSSSGL